MGLSQHFCAKLKRCRRSLFDEVAMLRKRKEPKRRNDADAQGSAAEKLATFEKVRAAGGFANEHPADLAEAEKILFEFVAMEKGRE
jgi:hypothetical protein